MLQIVIRPLAGFVCVLAGGALLLAMPLRAAEIADSCPIAQPHDLTSLNDPSADSPFQAGGITVESASSGPLDEAAALERRAAEQQRFQRILARRSALTASAPVNAGLDAARRARLAADDRVPLRVGEAVAVSQAVDFAVVPVATATAARAASAGQAARLADSSVAWEMELVSSGASALRLQFEDFDLADGVRLFVYNEAGQVRGPYAGRGPDANGGFWSSSVFGERVRLHVHADDAAAFAASRFVVAAAMHMGPRFHVADVIAASYQPGPAAPDGTFCGVTVPDCTINGVCAIASNPGLAAASDAVAQINFVRGGSGYICSGALINPSGSVRTPYFLTANHCFDSQASASSLEAHFRFRTAACDTSCTMLPTLEANGSTLMATGAAPARGDYTLVRLNSVPGGLMLLGWSAGHPAEGGYLIHLGHPGGSPLAYSVRRIRYGTGALPNCSGVPRPAFLYSGVSAAPSDAQGATAGGSSGGPAVLLASGGGSSYIVGQLYGACYAGTEAPCDANQEATVDGALEHSFPYLRQYLYNRIFSNGFD